MVHLGDGAAGRVALVCGSARCLWDDLDRLRALLGREWPAAWIAVNYTGVLLRQPIDHWVSLHPELFRFAPFARDHLDRGLRKTPRPAYQAHSDHDDPHRVIPIRIWDLPKGSCSGTFAARVALALYDRVVLAGCPHDGQGYFWDPPGRSTQYEDFFGNKGLKSWEEIAAEAGDRVLSMSGHTEGIFGGPDRAFCESLANDR